MHTDAPSRIPGGCEWYVNDMWMQVPSTSKYFQVESEIENMWKHVMVTCRFIQMIWTCLRSDHCTPANHPHSVAELWTENALDSRWGKGVLIACLFADAERWRVGHNLLWTLNIFKQYVCFCHILRSSWILMVQKLRRKPMYNFGRRNQRCILCWAFPCQTWQCHRLVS